MANPTTILRSLIIFSICLPLAIVLGYVVAGPFDYTFVGVLGTAIFILILPALLGFHHPMLLLSWNATMIVFFLPGQPAIWMPMVGLSLLISIVRRTIDQHYKFISVPSITWPLIAMAVVVLVTAEATGGIKLRSFGGEVFGGKRYILLLGAIAGYFAITAQQIPRNRAKLYVALFFLGGLTSLVSDVFYVDTAAFQYLYLLFPPSRPGDLLQGALVSRFYGLGGASTVAFYYMMARYGVREILSLTKPWRLLLLATFAFLGCLGGSRSTLIIFILVFIILFFLEGLHRTKLLPIMVVGSVLMAVVSLPFVERFPFAVQRTLSFLPIKVDPIARNDAETTAVWRLELWKAVLPEVPEYFFLGKGLALTAKDFDFSLSKMQGSIATFSQDQDPMALAGDYHSGPLSVTISFGVWGDIVFIWFLIAAFRALHSNYRYGDPDLRQINGFLLAIFATITIMFILIYGSFYNDMHNFLGYLALSFALNNGVAKPVREPAAVAAVKEPAFASMLPRPRSAFGRGD